MFAMPDAAQLVELAACPEPPPEPEGGGALSAVHPRCHARTGHIRAVARRGGRAAAAVPRARPGLSPVADRGPLPGLALEVRHRRRGPRIAGGQDGQLQGPHQRGRHPAGVHLAGPGGLHPRRGRDRRVPGAGGRRKGRRQAHDERVHGRLRQAAEPAQSGAHHRRVVVGLRGRAGRGRGGHLVRRRPGRLDPAARGLLRRGRAEADVRAGVALRGRLRRRAQRGSCRADGAHGAGRRGRAAGGGRIRRQRPAPAPRHPGEHRRAVRPGRRREGAADRHPRGRFCRAHRAGGRRGRPGGRVHAGEARRRGQPDLRPAACADRQRVCGAGVRGRAGDP